MDTNKEIKQPADAGSFGRGKENNARYNFIHYVIAIVVILFAVIYFFVSSPSRDEEVIVHVSSSDTLSSIGSKLKDLNVIRHEKLLKFSVALIGGDKNISKGDYLFEKNESLIRVAWQLSKGIHGIAPLKVTLREGLTNIEMAKILSDKIPGFQKDVFLSDLRTKQGYLFPDTYFFYSLSTTDEILSDLSSNFKNKILKVDSDIKASGKSISDIIVMASIIEKEANGKEDGPIISGILWKRLKLGMPLQVDAAPSTYDRAGLPSIPINNPGLSSINYAIHPVNSSYLFYLHDDYGNVHYAIDFSEHRSNITRYLK